MEYWLVNCGVSFPFVGVWIGEEGVLYGESLLPQCESLDR